MTSNGATYGVDKISARGRIDCPSVSIGSSEGDDQQSML
uniref:NADH dehydrogenase subunit 1 n=1 Tax=Parascaris univalens TaxID=6257 RepID=A0A915AZ35_PARUN